MKINLPEVLIHLRHRVVQQQTAGLRGVFHPEAIAMRAIAGAFRSERRFRAAQRLGRIAANALARDDGAGDAWISALPGYAGGWTSVRDLRAVPPQTFREWWAQRERSQAVSVNHSAGAATA